MGICSWIKTVGTQLCTVALRKHPYFVSSQLVQESEVCSSLQNNTEMTKTFAIFRNKYTGQIFYLLSGERHALSMLCVVLGGAGILVTCVRTSINKLQNKGKKGGKNNQHLAQKALLRLHSKCFYNINNKSNFRAW